MRQTRGTSLTWRTMLCTNPTLEFKDYKLTFRQRLLESKQEQEEYFFSIEAN